MASEAFQETVKAIPELLVEPAGFADDELDLDALRSFLSVSKFTFSNSTKVTKVIAGGVPAEWIIESDVKPEKRMAFFHGGGGSITSLLMNLLDFVNEKKIKKVKKALDIAFDNLYRTISFPYECRRSYATNIFRKVLRPECYKRATARNNRDNRNLPKAEPY